MKKFSFSKKYKLLKFNINNNFLNKYNFRITNYFNVYYIFNNLNYSRLGIFIRKKHIKYSFKRILIKRIIRESFRINKIKLKKIDILVTSKFNLDLFKNKLIFNDLNILWNLIN